MTLKHENYPLQGLLWETSSFRHSNDIQFVAETTKASFQKTFEPSTLCNLYKDGGLKSADVLNKFRSNPQRYSIKALAYVFFREFFEIFKNTFFTVHFWTCSWTKRLYDSITPCWKIIPAFFIKKQYQIFFLNNLKAH